MSFSTIRKSRRFGLHNFQGAHVSTDLATAEPVHVCGVNTEMMGGAIRKWQDGKKVITYNINFNTLGNLDRATIIGAFEASWEPWHRVTPLRFQYQEHGRADITYFSGFEDGAGRTLAWMEIPNGSGNPLRSKFDSSEHWVVSENPPRGRIDLVGVGIHENGHGLGILHIPGNVGKAIMNPVYVPGMRALTQFDIHQAQTRYGKREQGGGDNPPPLPPKKGKAVEKMILRYVGNRFYIDELEYEG